MVFDTSLSCVLASLAVAVACNAPNQLRVIETDWPREAVVSAQHTVPTQTKDVAGLALAAVETQVTLTWTDGAQRRLATSDDGARTLGDPVSAAASADVPQPVFELQHAHDHTWSVAPLAGAFSNITWTADAGDVSGPLLAIQELCGLVALVSVETAAAEQQVVLRRYLPPRYTNGRAGQRIGERLPLAVVPSHVSSIVAVPLVESAVVAWADSTAVHVVRVELPDVLCTGMAPRPLS